MDHICLHPQTRVKFDHPDLDLYKQDRFRNRAWLALLFPPILKQTREFMNSMERRPIWLSQDDADELERSVEAARRELAGVSIGARVERLRAIQRAARSGVLTPGVDDKRLMQRMFRLEHLPEVLKFCVGREDHYISQNTFSAPVRRSERALQLTSCFVDLDFYNLPDASTRRALADDADAVDLVLSRCELHHILPTQIVRSGRGLYVKWIFDEFVYAPFALPRWSAVQKYLGRLFEDLGSDPASKDAARVFRVAGSVNSKSDVQGGLVRTLLRSPPVNFDGLAAAVLPRPRLSEADREAVRLLDKSYKAAVAAGTVSAGKKRRPYAQPDAASAASGKKNTYGWAARCADELERLAARRGRDGSVGVIELTCFVILAWRVRAGVITDKDSFDACVRRLGTVMGADMKQLASKVESVWTRRDRSGAVMTKKYAVDQLRIGESELVLVPELARAPKSKSDRPDRAEPATTRGERAELIEGARELDRAGVPIGFICERFLITRRTLRRWLRSSA